MIGVKKVVLISEVGWRGIREFALFSNRKSVPSDIIIKGKVAKEVLAIITPYRGIKISSVPRLLFIPALVAKILGSATHLKRTIFIFSKERTQKGLGFLLRLVASRSFLLIETNDGYGIYDEGMRKIENLAGLLGT